MFIEEFEKKKKRFQEALTAHLQNVAEREEEEKRKALSEMNPKEYESWLKERERNKECY